MEKQSYKGECWLWPYAINKQGYGNLQRNNKSIDAHKFMYETLVGKVPVGCELDHLCRNRPCVNPEHLEAVSHAVNCRRGSQAKLTGAQVIEIRKQHGKASQREIGKKYGVSKATIGFIFNGKRYAA